MRHAIALSALALALIPASGAQAQHPTNDPDQGSPSGTIYELPFDTGRTDAAPRSHGGSGGSSGSSGDVSPIRSENNFGSSSIVPGAGGTQGASSAGSGSGSGPGSSSSKSGGGGSKSSSSGGKDGGSKGGGNALTPAEQERQASAGKVVRASAAPAPSSFRSLLLIAVGAIAAVALGAAARVASRRRG